MPPYLEGPKTTAEAFWNDIWQPLGYVILFSFVCAAAVYQRILPQVHNIEI